MLVGGSTILTKCGTCNGKGEYMEHGIKYRCWYCDAYENGLRL